MKKDWNSGTPGPRTFSATWSVAHESFQRLKTSADSWKYIGSYKVTPRLNIPVNYGDIVYADWKDDGRVDHAMIVTGFQNQSGIIYPRLTYHSTHRLDNPLLNFNANALGAKLYVFRQSWNTYAPSQWQIF